ncbi:MAG: nitrogenase component 1 [Thermotaleaceae bacterium]
MKGLLKKLPPFAPDYSGVSAIFYPLEGITIINGADGCIGNVTGYDEPRFFEKGGLIFSSGLREINAITGDERSLLEKIKDIHLSKDIPFIILLGTPTSAVIASDHKGLSRLLMREKNIPVLTINTTGIDTYEKGLEKGFYQLAKILPHENLPLGGGVNILGATPLDYWGKNQIEAIKKALHLHGISINSSWTMNSTFQDIQRTLAADVNLVISASAIKAAQYLYDTYNMPYILGVPVGTVYTQALAAAIKGEKPLKQILPPRKTTVNNPSKKGLIIGEQIWANSFRAYLKAEEGFEQVKVTSFFEMKSFLMDFQDQQLLSETDLETLIDSYQPTHVFGDPLYELFFKEKEVVYYKIPHLALSSRIYWDHTVMYVGNEINVIHKHRMEENR